MYDAKDGHSFTFNCIAPTYNDDDCGNEHEYGWYPEGQGVAGVVTEAFNILEQTVFNWLID